jgi:hypothetical protein
VSRTTRRDYTGSKRFDSTCRNHGSCGYCSSGRQFASKRRASYVEAITGMNPHATAMLVRGLRKSQ